MSVQHLAHCLQQRRLAHAGFRFVLVPAAVTAIDALRRVSEERAPSRVEVELKARNIHAVERGHSGTNKVLASLAEFGIFLSNLPIPQPALRSTHAAKHDEQRFPIRFSRSAGIIEVRVPTGNDILGKCRAGASGQ